MNRLGVFVLGLLLSGSLSAQTISGGGSGITSLTSGVTATGPGAAAATVVTNANLTGDVTSVGNATTLVSVANASAGTLPAARGGAGTINGALKANGSGTVTQAACADLSNGATGCSTTVGTSATVNTGTSGATIPLLNGVNTWSALQTITPSASNIGMAFNGNVDHIVMSLVDTDAFIYAQNGFWLTNTTTFGGIYFSAVPGQINVRTTNASTSYLTSIAGDSWQLGAVDAAAPAAQTLSAQNVVAGTSNTAGALWKFSDSAGTGTGASGGYEWDTHPLGGSGTSKNAASSKMTLTSAGLLSLPGITSDAGKTDATICEDTTNHSFYSGSGTLGVCLGTSSARFKHDIAPLAVGLDQIMRLRPVSYKLNADHGDPDKTLYGFTAEDMDPVLPKLVGLDAKGLPNSADYVGLIPVLVRAVQQQQTEIDALKQRLVKDDLIMAQYRPEPIALRQ